MVVVGDDVVVGGCGGEAVLGGWVGAAEVVDGCGGAAVVVDDCGGEAVGGDEVGDNFKNPNPPPNESLSVLIMISPVLVSTLRYSPALLALLSP